RQEAFEPVAVAVQRSAHVQKNRANHWPEATRSQAREKLAIRVTLPTPEEQKGEIHRPEHEREKQIDPVEADEDPNRKKPGVIPKKIPPPDDGVEHFPVALAVWFG